MAETKPPLIEDHDIQSIDALGKALVELEITKNNIELSEFKRFAPLFRSATRDEITADVITKLSAEFMTRVDPYNDIRVMSNNAVLFTIPRIFMPVKDISDTYQKDVDRFHSDGGSDIPKYAAEAVGGMIDAIFKSQGDLNDGEYAKHIETLAADYKKHADRFKQAEPASTDSVDKTDTEVQTFDVDDDDSGLQWD